MFPQSVSNMLLFSTVFKSKIFIKKYTLRKLRCKTACSKYCEQFLMLTC